MRIAEPNRAAQRPTCVLMGMLTLVACTSTETRNSAARSTIQGVIRLGGGSGSASTTNGGGRIRAAASLVCPTPARGAHGLVRVNEGNPAARTAAQRALGFVAREAIGWQRQHNCYGCHVQAVTLEALTVGRHHQYDVPQSDMDEVIRGMTTISGGARGSNGFSVQNDPNHLIETSRTFGGAATARYDLLLTADLRDDMLHAARQITEYQNADGSVRSTDTRFPVVNGLIQATTQALQTWRVAYARTAEASWLVPIRRAEQSLQTRSREVLEDRSATTIDLNYAIMGLLEAGAQAGEPVVMQIGRRLRERQREDGGWGFREGESSVAFATGQTLFSLRSAGAADTDPAVQRGTHWLVEHQSDDGGWSHSGSGRAEAMWAVLGLVSVDVMSLQVTGVRDGQHAAQVISLRAQTTDNAGHGVERVEVLVDDVPIHRQCGANADTMIDPSVLEPGVHQIDVVATNGQHQTTHRRFEIYAGQYYVTHLGALFANDATLLSWRNVAPAEVHGRVSVAIHSVGADGAAGPEVFRTTLDSAQGAMNYRWDGRRANGDRAARGRYLARVSLVGANGQAMHTAESAFTHDTAEVEQREFGAVGGQATVGSGGAGMANAQVDLLDAQGRVVQRTQTTEAGNYRFSGVARGNYRVRIRRQGFVDMEAPAAAAPASHTSVSMPMQLAH